MMKRTITLICFLLLLSLSAAAQFNSSQSAKQATLATQNITSAAAGTGVDTTGYSYVLVMYKGTYTTNATAAGFQVSVDGGTTYIDQAFYVQGSTNTCLYQTVTGDLTDNSTNVFALPIAGYNRVRTNALNWGSGTIAVTIVGTASGGAPCQQLANFPALNSTTDSITAKTDQTTHGTTDLVSADVTKIAGTATDANSGNKSAGTLRVVLATDQPQLTNKLLVTPDSVALPANQSVNVAQMNGVATTMGSGTSGTGVQRVVIATDQPALTNKLLVTPDSVALPANQSVNAAQVAGTAVDTNSGVKSAGTQRVVLATDQPALTNKLLVTPDSVALPANQSVNVSQINGVTTLMGNGTSGTGAQRVTIASDSTGQIALAAGSATIGALAANQSMNAAQIAGATTSTAAAGIQKVGIVGNAAATVDSAVAAGTAPTNQIVVGSVYNSSAPAPTTGQAMAHQSDQAGNLRTAPAIATATLSVWNSGTSVNATQNVFINSGAPAVLVHVVDSSGTFTAGAITFEVTYDNSNWITISADAVLDPTSTTLAQQAVPYTLITSTNKAFLVLSKGAQGLRIKLSTAITGTGTATPNYALLPYSPAQQTVLAAGAATIGSLAANQSSNVAQINGVTPLMGAGNTGTGSVRVTISTDQAQLTNKLLVTPDSVALPANQSVNMAQVGGTNTVNGGVAGVLAVGGNVANAVAATANPVPVGGIFTTTPATLTTGQTATRQFTAAQNAKDDLTTIAGTATDTNSGTKSAGTLRVVIATDQPALTNKLLVTPDSVALPANQSVNVAQINGVTTLMGNGASGTGAQRVTIASDSTGVVGLNAGSNLIGQVAPVATATTTNAATPYFLTSAATTNSTTIKASAGNVYGYHLINTTATLYYLRMYNASSAPTCSSATNFVKTIPVPASATGAGVVVPITVGEAYATGISFCLTGGGSSTDNTNAATGVYINILYK